MKPHQQRERFNLHRNTRVQDFPGDSMFSSLEDWLSYLHRGATLLQSGSLSEVEQ